MPRTTGLAVLLCLAIGTISCSNADADARAKSAPTARASARNMPDEAALVRLIDARLRVALARERAFDDVRHGQTRARVAIDEASQAARSQLERSGLDEDARQSTEQLVSQLDEFSEQVATLDQRDANVDAFEADVLAALEDVESARTIYGDDGAGSSGSPVGAELLSGIEQNLNGVLTILDQVKQARSALEQIASGSVPDEYAGSSTSDYYADDEYYEDEYDWSDDAYDDPYAETDPDDGNGEGVGAGLQAEPARIDVTGSPVLGRADADSYQGLSIAVLSLERTSGGTVTLKLALQNDADAEIGLDKRSLFYSGSNYGWSLKGVGLIDLASGRRFKVMQDSEGTAMASSGGYSDHKMASGERRELWARFADVPGDVRHVSVVVPGFPPIDDIEIVD